MQEQILKQELRQGMTVEKTANLITKQLIREHLNTLQKIKIAKAEKCDQLRAELEELEKPFDIEAEAVKSEIIKIIPEIGESVKTEAGIVRYREGTLRKSYPRKELDAFLDENPDLAEKIRPLRKETKIAPSISVEVY